MRDKADTVTSCARHLMHITLICSRVFTALSCLGAMVPESVCIVVQPARDLPSARHLLPEQDRGAGFHASSIRALLVARAPGDARRI